jgi:hypothetical protein
MSLTNVASCAALLLYFLGSLLVDGSLINFVRTSALLR